MTSPAALKVIRSALRQVEEVRQLLRALGDHEDTLDLAARFRQVAKRLTSSKPDQRAANLYGKLTLAFHRLGLTLDKSFYPPPSGDSGDDSFAIQVKKAYSAPMRQPSFRQSVLTVFLCGFCLLVPISLGIARGDQVEMVNGDRYVGRVISLGNDVLVIQNEFLGTLKLPRAKISSIALEPSPARSGTNALRAAPSSLRSNRVAQIPGRVATNAAPDFASVMHELGTNSSVIQKVQEQFLAGAGPEAQTKFNDLVTGLMSGKVGVNELRTEARNTLEQARSARKELGEEGGSSLDSYLAILESFLKESEPATGSSNSPTNAASATPRPEQPAADE